MAVRRLPMNYDVRHHSTDSGAAMDHELLERLELKIAYLERANHDLSDVVYRQQRELDELRVKVTAVVGRFYELTQQRPYSAEEERPPHY